MGKVNVVVSKVGTKVKLDSEGKTTETHWCILGVLVNTSAGPLMTSKVFITPVRWADDAVGKTIEIPEEVLK